MINTSFNNIDLDKIFSDFILDKTNIFSFIHPNILSISGFFISIGLYFLIISQVYLLIAIALFFRYCCDVLDGAVARKYNKVSNLGGALDTIADNTLIFILGSSIFYLLNFNYYFLFGIVLSALNLLYMYKCKSLIHHTGIKQGGNILQNIYSFFVNNNCLLYITVFIVIVWI